MTGAYADPDPRSTATMAGHELSDRGAVTRLLEDADAGNEDAWHGIYALLYEDLHRIARSQIRRQSGTGLSPTSLVSETWLKLAGATLSIESRRHLTALLARAMRFVLLDETRRLLTNKRTGAGGATELQDDIVEADTGDRLEQLLSLDQALEDLGRIDARLSRVVELRYFGGLTEDEVAASLGLNVRTIRRDWRRARAYLLNRLGADGRGVTI